METVKSAGDGTPSRTRVGVVREIDAGERRVALVPKAIPSLVQQGVAVVVESEAGLGASIPDSAYVEAGAEIGDPYSADVVVKVAAPNDSEIAKLSSGQTLIG
ncbi:NAD(P)(+) transhydrogenase (Re/Si-specific) subunit alpha, partial [Nocardia sp. NPDC059246]